MVHSKRFLALLLGTGLVFLLLGIIVPLPVQRVTVPEVVYQKTPCLGTEPAEKVVVNGIGLFGNTSQGEIVKIVIESKRGTGRLFVDFLSGAYAGTDLQASVVLAAEVASEYTGRWPDDLDYFLTFESSTAEVSGSSGTAGIAAGMVALMQGRKVRQDTAVTGFVNESLQIGEVLKVWDKVRVAQEAGMKRVIIPAVQCNQTMIANYTIQVICAENFSDVVNDLLE